MKRTERRYDASETAFFLRLCLGNLCCWYTMLSDQRRGRETKLPYLKHHVKGGYPYYLSSDMLSYIEQVRREFPDARAKVPPCFIDIDVEHEIEMEMRL